LLGRKRFGLLPFQIPAVTLQLDGELLIVVRLLDWRRRQLFN